MKNIRTPLLVILAAILLGPVGLSTGFSERTSTKGHAEAPLLCSFATSPTLQWWVTFVNNEVNAPPVVVNLTDDNGDGVVDACDNPEVAFIEGYVLCVVDGTTGSTLFRVGSSLGACGLAAADIVGNSVAELIAIETYEQDSVRIVAFDATGRQVVTGDPTIALGADAFYATISVADLSSDGTPEILVGEVVFDGATGDSVWCGSGGRGRFENSVRSSAAVNLDTLGDLEVLAGNTAYRSNGTIFWQFGNRDGGSAVGDYDTTDGYPEVVFVRDSTIFLLDGVEKASQLVVVDSLRFGTTDDVVFPALGQFDSDAEPEVAETDGDSLYALDFNTSTSQWEKMWTADVNDTSGTRAGLSVADLDGDGFDEVIYRDLDSLWIFDGRDGSVEWHTRVLAVGTYHEYPVAADIDGDDRMEVVVAGGYTYARGVSAFECSSWVDGRRIWNDYTYHVTNINEDGTVPVNQDKCWLTDNSFLAQENRCVLCDKEAQGDWTIEVVRDATTGPFNAIALRDNTFPHVGFRDDSINGLWYAFKDTIPRRFKEECDSFPLWRTVEVDTGVAAQWASIGILPRSLYAEFSYADASSWDVEWTAASAPDDTSDCYLNLTNSDLDTRGYQGTYGTDMALDTLDGEPYSAVVYYSGRNGNLKYAERYDTHWTVTTIDSAGDVGRYPAIAIDGYGYRHVSYYDATKGDLKYAWCPSGCSLAVNWSFAVPDSTAGATVGLFTEIAVSPSGSPRMSYVDSTHRSVKCASFRSGVWDTATVDPCLNDLVASTSIGVAGEDTIHVSYSDRTEKSLKCASCYHNCDDAGNWDALTIPDSWSDVGLWNSIAVGRGDTVHISYSGSDSVCDFKALKYVVGKP